MTVFSCFLWVNPIVRHWNSVKHIQLFFFSEREIIEIYRGFILRFIKCWYLPSTEQQGKSLRSSERLLKYLKGRHSVWSERKAWEKKKSSWRMERGTLCQTKGGRRERECGQVSRGWRNRTGICKKHSEAKRKKKSRILKSCLVKMSGWISMKKNFGCFLFSQTEINAFVSRSFIDPPPPSVSTCAVRRSITSISQNRSGPCRT